MSLLTPDEMKIAPPWMLEALKDVGFHEKEDNQAIEAFIRDGKCGVLGNPWCSISACAWVERAAKKAADKDGKLPFRSPRNASSQSWRRDPSCTQLAGPALGAIAVFWRGANKNSGIGHVGFYRGERDGYVWVLGGNEGDMVQVEALAKSSSHFGLWGYWWPRGYPLPTIKPIFLNDNVPKHQTKVV